MLEFAAIFAALAALVVSTGLAVLIGSQGARYLEMVPLKLIAGIGFLAIGGWSISAPRALSDLMGPFDGPERLIRAGAARGAMRDPPARVPDGGQAPPKSSLGSR